MKLGYLLIFLGVLILSACSGAPSPYQPEVIQPGTAGYDILPDFPTGPQDLRAGGWFRGFQLQATTDAAKFCMHRCTDPLVGQTWVWYDQQFGLVFGKIVDKYAVDDVSHAWRIMADRKGVTAITIDLGGGNYLTGGTDLGEPWDYFWGKTAYDEVKYQKAVDMAMKEVEANLDQGMAFTADFGCYQCVVKADAAGNVIDVSIVDFDTVTFADDKGKFGMIADNREQYLNKMREKLDSSISVSSGPKAMPAGESKPVAAAAEETHPVRFVSPEGTSLGDFQATNKQLEMLRKGGKDAATVSKELGVPVAEIGWGGKLLRFAGKGIVYAVDVYVVYDLMRLEYQGIYGPTDLEPATEQPTNIPLDTELWNWLITPDATHQSFEGSAALKVYRTTAFFMLSNAQLTNSCHTFRLNGMPMWEKTKIPLIYCYANGLLTVQNTQTGEVSTMDLTDASAPVVVSGWAATTFTAAVPNGAGEYVLMPFDAYISGETFWIEPSYLR